MPVFPIVGGTGVLWWLYVDHRMNSNETTIAKEEQEASRDNTQALLVYAIAATVFTVGFNRMGGYPICETTEKYMI